MTVVCQEGWREVCGGGGRTRPGNQATHTGLHTAEIPGYYCGGQTPALLAGRPQESSVFQLLTSPAGTQSTGLARYLLLNV